MRIPRWPVVVLASSHWLQFVVAVFNRQPSTPTVAPTLLAPVTTTAPVFASLGTTTPSPAFPVATTPWVTTPPIAETLRARGGQSCSAYAQQPCQNGLKPGTPVNWGLFCRDPKDVSGLYAEPLWIGRSAVVSSLLWEKPPSFVLDLGSGCLELARLLPSSTRYIPSDSVLRPQVLKLPHGTDLIACDYNQGLIPRLPEFAQGDMYGMITALGVLEYMCDVRAFLEALKSYQLPIILSYAPAEKNLMIPAALDFRSNTLNKDEWQSLLQEVGFTSAHRQASVVGGGIVNYVYWFEPSPSWWHSSLAARRSPSSEEIAALLNPVSASSDPPSTTTSSSPAPSLDPAPASTTSDVAQGATVSTSPKARKALLHRAQHSTLAHVHEKNA